MRRSWFQLKWRRSTNTMGICRHIMRTRFWCNAIADSEEESQLGVARVLVAFSVVL